MTNQYQKDVEAYIDKATQKPSFKKYLKDKGLINSDKETDDTDIGRNFREYIDRKEDKDNEQK